MLIFKILLIFHVFGDFYLQSDNLTSKKEKHIGFLLLHVLLYTLPFLSLFFFSKVKVMTLFMVLLIFVSHFIFDLLKLKIKNINNKKVLFFVIDQALHIIVISVVYFVLKDTFITLSGKTFYIEMTNLGFDFSQIISILLIFMLILKPTSVLVELCLPKQKDLDDDLTKQYLISEQNINNNEVTDYGNLIGYLERTLIVLLVIANLWSSVAIVIAAKSIARFKQLEDKEFAQKYLIGTLLSLSITLAFLLLFL